MISYLSETVDPFHRLCLLLQQIDEVHQGQSGKLVFGDDSQGVILVQAGRVCWAASQAMPTRLIHRLSSSDG